MKKNVLIIGAKSYIGTHIKEWLLDKSDYSVDLASARDDQWKSINYYKYDVVINVTGVAHIKIKKSMDSNFYKVNTDLAVDICKIAKKSGVKQYIYLSSMNVYGDTSKVITKDMIPIPKNFYGGSKLKADVLLQEYADDNFSVVSLRPPVVYGKGCKGNFPKLVKLASLCPIFPNYSNTRSMLYIDNLCEIVRLVIENNSSGILHPQNKELTSTVQMVEMISSSLGKKMILVNLFNPLIRLMVTRVHLVNRMFADDSYSLELSNIFDFKYAVVSTEESIRRSI